MSRYPVIGSDLDDTTPTLRRSDLEVAQNKKEVKQTPCHSTT